MSGTNSKNVTLLAALLVLIALTLTYAVISPKYNEEIYTGINEYEIEE